LPVFLLNLKGDTEIALKQREGSALMYRYLRLFGIPVILFQKVSLRIVVREALNELTPPLSGLLKRCGF
jgi:hypothetical protein